MDSSSRSSSSSRRQKRSLKALIKLYSATLAYLLLVNAVQAEVLSRNDAAPPPLPVSLAGSSKLACRPVGECEMCPPHMRNEPVCRVHGNRRPVHCIVLDEADLPQQQKHGAPPGAPPNAFKGNGPFIKRPPKHPIVELPPRPGAHPHLLDNKDKYIAANEDSGKKQPDHGPVKLRRDTTILERDGHNGGSDNAQQQTFATWEPCVRAIDAERKDYWEFVLANLGFAAVALFIVVVRGRIIAARHYNQVVNLIGFKPLQQFLRGGDETINEMPGRAGASRGTGTV